MELEADKAYDRQRLQLIRSATTAASNAWLRRDPADTANWLAATHDIADAAAEAYVELINDYFSLRATTMLGREVDHRVDPDDFTRDTFSEQVSFTSPIGVLTHSLAAGKDFNSAEALAKSDVEKVMRRFLALVGTRAAHEWMTTYE